jgi:hypothetical protein
MNTAYKHLDTKLRIADLTLGQWAGIGVGILVAVCWGNFVSPFGSYATLVTSVYIGGLPVGAAVLASISEFNVGLLLRSMLAWRRRSGRFVPGPGESSRGYLVKDEPEQARARAEGLRAPQLDLASLWEEA